MANSHSGQDGREYPFERRRRPHRQPGARVGIYLLTWAMAQGLVENNPVIGTAKNEEKSRDRVLTPAELRLIWNALEDTQHGRFIKLLALNGQRLNEIGRLRWSEVHDDQIILPAERTKNAWPHVLPLSEAAATIIAQQPKRASDLIFGNGNEKGFSGSGTLSDGRRSAKCRT